jgi:hypothetical protein
VSKQQSPSAFDDWDSQRERKLTLGLEASPAQRLLWLEEAIAFAYRAGALPRPRPEADRDL